MWLDSIFGRISAIIDRFMHTLTTMHRHLWKTGIVCLLALGMFVMHAEPVFAEDSCVPPICSGCGDRTRFCNCNPSACEAVTGQPLSRPQRGIPLLEPLDGSPRGTTIPSSAGIGIFFTYFNAVWPWLLGTAAGIAVLRALIGGIRIMLSGSDSGMREEGKSNILWALVGLLIIGLAGLILETINPFFYVQS